MKSTKNMKSKTDMTEAEKNLALSDMLYMTSCANHGVKPNEARVRQMNMDNLYRMSRFHTLTNIVFEAVLSAYGGKLPDSPVLKKWREERDKAVTKNLLLDAERTALFAWMEEAGIWYMPLKGSILKEFYPKSGMRQMADNDILFDAAYQEQVRDWFLSRGYEIKDYNRGVHDSYLKAPVYNFEMHRMLFSDAFQPDNKAFVHYYTDVKRRLLPDDGKRYGYHFSDEDFYLYITAHACKHYRGGGTGLRTLLDFYVYLSAKSGSLNWDYIHAELPKLNLVEFEGQTRELAGKVFADPEGFSAEQLSASEQQMLGYYLSSGTYGTVEQHVQNRLSKMGDTDGGVSRKLKIRYVWNRLFPNQEFMEYWCQSYAPFFLKHKWLMPLAAVWRLFYKGITNIGKWKREIGYLIKAK